MADAERLAVSRRILAPAVEIFALLTDPRGHVELDGTGMLIAPQDDTPLSAVGDSFLMDMDGVARGLPELGTYVVEVTVTTFAENSELEWTIGRPGEPPHGHLYGYRFAPAGGSVTEVVHYYDWSHVTDAARARIKYPVITADALYQSLVNLDRVLAGRARG